LSTPSLACRSRWRITAVSLTVAFGTTACGHLHGHHDHIADPAALTLNAGQKWLTDAPLRQGMAAVRMLTLQVSAGVTPSDSEAARLADGLRRQVAFMVGHCKLEPKADAALHVLIADLLKGADGLGPGPTRDTGMARIRNALKQYPDYFIPPGW
jgi:polysaccharide deacetylase 2 family uncharacterized protein YibQ